MKFSWKFELYFNSTWEVKINIGTIHKLRYTILVIFRPLSSLQMLRAEVLNLFIYAYPMHTPRTFLDTHVIFLQPNLLLSYPPASAASRGVYWNQAQNSSKCFFQFSNDNKEKGNHEIVPQKRKKKIFLPHLDLNHGPLKQKASVLPNSFADPFILFIFIMCVRLRFVIIITINLWSFFFI